MEARMTNPAMVLPDALPAMMALGKAAEGKGIPLRLRELVCLRASQINGCGLCVDMHSKILKRSGEKDERIYAVGAWRESPHFTDTERAALALAEAMTRISDNSDPVPDKVWGDATAHFGKEALAALILSIAIINAWNRLNVTTRQPANEWERSPDAQKMLEKVGAAA